MHESDPEHTFFLLKWSGQLIVGVVVLLLGLLSYLGRRNQAQVASAVIQEKPVSQAQLVKCQLEVTQSIAAGFDGLRRDLMKEITLIHDRINQHERDCNK